MTPVLEELFPVKFGFAGASGLAGRIITRGEMAVLAPNGSKPVPSLAFSSGKPLAEVKVSDRTIRFADVPDVPFPFRGRVLRTKAPVHTASLALNSGDVVLAADDAGPLWTVCKAHDANQYRAAFQVPPIPAGGGLQDVLNSERFFELLPLLHWLRELTAGAAFEGPRLRASFIVDDPNLHWPSYGFVNFRELASRAARANYHVCFATIPLDAWFTHGRTAEIFRENADRLSLCVHGNNHSKAELARDYSESGRLGLLGQALQRIEHLERVSDVEVSRVMIPPHGACSEAMLAELGKGGFEAACLSHGSLRAHNRGKPWTTRLGYKPTEWIRGCPVLPRWGLAGNIQNTVLLAAFLNQPILLRGHHQDFRNGTDVLDEMAQFINGLGPVSWANMSDLGKSNYQSRIEGSTLKIRPFCRKLRVQLPPKVDSLVVDAGDEQMAASCSFSDSGVMAMKVRNGEVFRLPSKASREVILETASETDVRANGVAHPAPWPVFRRLLTEGRDRFVSFRWNS
jgi:hypothetical protein